MKKHSEYEYLLVDPDIIMEVKRKNNHSRDLITSDYDIFDPNDKILCIL